MNSYWNTFEKQMCQEITKISINMKRFKNFLQYGTNDIKNIFFENLWWCNIFQCNLHFIYGNNVDFNWLFDLKILLQCWLCSAYSLQGSPEAFLNRAELEWNPYLFRFFQEYNSTQSKTQTYLRTADPVWLARTTWSRSGHRTWTSWSCERRSDVECWHWTSVPSGSARTSVI